MSAVLVPLLGRQLAMERANNIAQVLVFTDDDPARVAQGMLRGMGLSDLTSIASEVRQAWESGIEEAVA